MIGWLVATLASVGGLYGSFHFDLPTGAAIVCVLGMFLLATAVGSKLFRPGKS
ncbi:MAG TPA: metal ABC transporter permease [Candidatus Paceibacterota bacterium]|nr:metal ABC transporter permease [Candidatus Paceibacterota bacterium]